MRSVDQIVKRLKEEQDFFGFQLDVLLPYLRFETAKQFLKPDITPEWWQEQGFPVPMTEEHAKEEMTKYMAFAWTKVEDHRGLSASRSVEKMKAWVWLLEGDEDIDWENYAQYGAPVLKAVCEKYDLPIPDSEALRNMAEGKPCYDGCEMGCGK